MQIRVGFAEFFRIDRVLHADVLGFWEARKDAFDHINAFADGKADKTKAIAVSGKDIQALRPDGARGPKKQYVPHAKKLRPFSNMTSRMDAKMQQKINESLQEAFGDINSEIRLDPDWM